jgi:PIN domain nuclease of toxin-antitoxin system
MTLDAAVYAFVDDFIDEGASQVAKRLASQGFSAVALAAVYHAARDLLPQ